MQRKNLCIGGVIALAFLVVILREAEDLLFAGITYMSSGEPLHAGGSIISRHNYLRHRTTELGHTWLIAACRGARINTEAKLLQLTYAFETLNLNRVAFKTHHENLQSQNAMKAIGCVYEGTFRNHYIMPDGSLRNSVWFSIIREDWPEVKALLHHRLAASTSAPQ